MKTMMTPKVSLIVAALSIVLILGTAAFAGNVLAIIAALGAFFAGMTVMSAVFHWPDR